MPEPKDKIKKDKPEVKQTKTVAEIKMETESDVFTLDEKKEICRMVADDVEYGLTIQADYIAQKVKDLQHYHCEAPSKLEGLTKKPWMSDRNLGLARAVADSYQSVLFATCWTPDSINFVATRTSDINNRNNQEKFTKWGMGKQEADAAPEVDQFIHNRLIAGTSYFKIYRKTWEEWVDKRIPVKNSAGETYKWEIKTEKVKLEKGIIENIPDIDDILMPEYGKNIQELPFFIEGLHLDGEGVLGYIDRKVFKPTNKEDYKKKLYSHAYSDKKSKLSEEKLASLGIAESDMGDTDVRRLPIHLYEWYGYYTKNNRRERYRFIVDTANGEFLSGKPVRKINRSGKIPFVGGTFAREPGQLRGQSLMQMIAPIVNAFNCVFNQKSDFQYVTNCPFGFHNPEEGYTDQVYELEPMVSYPVGGKPNESVYFPNIQRSMAWAESDLRILFEVLERLTGAASYFSTQQLRNKTLGQDLLVEKGSETRFGLQVKRIMEDICEAIGMWFELYQDYPPKNLSERVLGEDGKQLFPNLSIDSLRGDTAVQMTPDSVAGSKIYRKQLQIEVFQAGQQMFWLQPQVNPRGNWNLCADTLKELKGMTDNEIKNYLGEQPKSQFPEAELDSEWVRFLNGEDFDPPEGETAMAMQHLLGHQKQKEEKLQDLDEEYRPNLEAHIFKTAINAFKFMQNIQKETMINKMAASQVITQPQGQPPAPGAAPTGPAPAGLINPGEIK